MHRDGFSLPTPSTSNSIPPTTTSARTISTISAFAHSDTPLTLLVKPLAHRLRLLTRFRRFSHMPDHRFPVILIASVLNSMGPGTFITTSG